jgi:hypothetical protein
MSAGQVATYILSLVQKGERDRDRLKALYGAYEKQERSALQPEAWMVRDIIKLVWLSLFQRYFWLKGQQDQGANS